HGQRLQAVRVDAAGIRLRLWLSALPAVVLHGAELRLLPTDAADDQTDHSPAAHQPARATSPPHDRRGRIRALLRESDASEFPGEPVEPTARLDRPPQGNPSD